MEEASARSNASREDRFFIAVRDDRPLEWEVEQCAEGRLLTLLVRHPAVPDAQLSAALREGDWAARELHARDNGFEPGVGDVVREEHWAEGTCAGPLHEQVCVSDVVGQQDDGRCRGAAVKALPEADVFWGGERVEDVTPAPRLHVGGGDDWVPVRTLRPERVP